MASEKTQELLNSLQGIIKKPRKKGPVDVVVSNQYGEDAKGNPIYIDRLYGGLNGQVKLINKNFTEYKGKIKKRTILLKGKDGNFKSYSYETADGRWFNRCGMPIEQPKKKLLIKEEPQESSIEVQKIEPTADEKMQMEKDFLKNLK